MAFTSKYLRAPTADDLKATAHFLFLFFCLLYFGVSCKKSDDTTPLPPPPEQGYISFTYTGDTTGTFLFTGDIPNPPLIPNNVNQWTTGLDFTDFGKEWIGIGGSSGGLGIPLPPVLFQATVPYKGVGKYPLKSDFSNDFISFNNGNINPGVSKTYEFTSGTIDVTIMSKSRIAGTFAGSGTDNPSGKSIQLTNGKFDVKVTTQ